MNAGAGGAAGGRAGSQGGVGGRGGSSGAAGKGGAAGGKGGGNVGVGGASAGGAAGSATGFGGHAGSMGAGGASAGCSISVVPIAPASFDDIEAGPGVIMRVMAVATNATATKRTWHWQVMSDALETIQPEIKDNVGATIAFPIATPGQYRIMARLEGESCTGGTQFVRGLPPGPPTLIFRTTMTGLPVQETRVNVADGSSAFLMVASGQDISIRPLFMGQNNLLPAFVRISSPATSFVVEGDTTRGPWDTTLLPYLTYDLLLVPTDTSVAPELLSALPGVWQSQGIVLDQGIPVSGTMLDAAGAPVRDARLILKRGLRPSTVGVSDENGQMTLRTRDGMLSAIVVPPLGLGLPQANVVGTSTSGIDLPLAAPSLSVTMQWSALARGNLTIAVRGTDGAAVAGARVRVGSHPGGAVAGTLTASIPGGAVATLVATGSFNVEVVADDKGTAAFGLVPAADYDVTVVPPPEIAGAAAITTLPVTVPAVGLTVNVDLARKVALTGTLAPLPAAAGALVTAVDKGAWVTGSIVSARAGTDGRFALLVDPKRDYELVVKPSAGQPVARHIMRVPMVLAQATDAGKITLPRALPFTGTVVGDGRSMAGALVQVFCVATAASCVDPTLALAETTARGDGTFALILPDLNAPMTAPPPSSASVPRPVPAR